LVQNDEDVTEEFGSLGAVLIGLIDRRFPLRSAALLLSYCAKKDGCYSVFEDTELGCASYIDTDLEAPEVYRLLLAYCGCCPRGVIEMDDTKLVTYRGRGMKCGFEAVEAIIA
jgi:hypothetical protein